MLSQEPVGMSSLRDVRFVIFSNSIFCSLASIIVAIVYCILRSGFANNSVELLFPITGTALFLLNFPSVISFYLQKRNPTAPDYECSFQLLALAMIGILGALKFQGAFYIAVVGYLLFAYSLSTLIVVNVFNTLKLVVVSVFFALLCASVSWAYYADSLLLESLTFDKTSYCCWNLDPLFQTSVIQMIKTYGVASSGLDGVPAMNYHTGAHWLLSEMSVFFNIHVVDMFHYAYPVIFIPFFTKVILTVVRLIQKLIAIPVKFDGMLYFYVVVVMMGFIHVDINRIRLGKYVAGTLRESPAFLVSESYLISIVILLGALSFIIALYGAKRSLLTALVVPLFIGLCAFVKISTGYIFMAIITYLLFRQRLFKKPVFVISFVLTCFLFYFIYSLAVEQKAAEGTISFLHHYKSNKTHFIPFFFVYFLPAFIAVGLTLYFRKLIKLSLKNHHSTAVRTWVLTVGCSLSKIRVLYRNNHLLVAEIIIVAIGAGLLPTVVLEFASYNALYFTDVVFWIAIAAILAFSPFLFKLWYKKESYATRRSAIATCIFIAVVAYFMHGYYTSVKRLANRSVNVNNLRVRKLIANDTTSSSFIKELKNYFRDSEKRERLVAYYAPAMEAQANKNDFYVLLKQLKSLDTVDLQKKSRSLVYFNYAKLPSIHPLFCYQAPFIIPALTGMAMIDGAPQQGCYKSGYGFEHYTYRSKEVVNREYTPAELCAKVKDKGFDFLCLYNWNSRKFEWHNCQ